MSEPTYQHVYALPLILRGITNPHRASPDEIRDVLQDLVHTSDEYLLDCVGDPMDSSQEG